MSTSSQDHRFVHRSYLSGWASGDGKVEIFYKDPAARFRVSPSDDIEALAATAALLWARGEQARAACADIAGQTITNRSLGVLGRLKEHEDLFEQGRRRVNYCCALLSADGPR